MRFFTHFVQNRSLRFFGSFCHPVAITSLSGGSLRNRAGIHPCDFSSYWHYLNESATSSAPVNTFSCITFF
jgi:hypothetical protein